MNSSDTRTLPSTPTITPMPNSTPWPDRYTDPAKICPAQRREATSPDVAP